MTSEWDWSSPSICCIVGCHHILTYALIYDVTVMTGGVTGWLGSFTSRWQLNCREMAPFGHLLVIGVCHLISGWVGVTS